MGSGGGGGGAPPPRSGGGSRPPRKSKQPPNRFSDGIVRGGTGSGGGGAAVSGTPEECQLYFETDLTGVDPSVLGDIEKDAELTVVTHREGRYLTAVCRTAAGRIAGSLANIEDLATLIGCMQQGHRYIAHVRDVGEHHCTVLVEPR